MWLWIVVAVIVVLVAGVLWSELVEPRKARNRYRRPDRHADSATNHQALHQQQKSTRDQLSGGNWSL